MSAVWLESPPKKQEENEMLTCIGDSFQLSKAKTNFLRKILWTVFRSFICLDFPSRLTSRHSRKLFNIGFIRIWLSDWRPSCFCNLSSKHHSLHSINDLLRHMRSNNLFTCWNFIFVRIFARWRSRHSRNFSPVTNTIQHQYQERPSNAEVMVFCSAYRE